MFVSGTVRFTNWFEQVDLGASLVCPEVTVGTVASQKEAPSASILRPPCLCSTIGYPTWVKTADKNLREREF